MFAQIRRYGETVKRRIHQQGRSAGIRLLARRPDAETVFRAAKASRRARVVGTLASVTRGVLMTFPALIKINRIAPTRSLSAQYLAGSIKRVAGSCISPWGTPSPRTERRLTLAMFL